MVNFISVIFALLMVSISIYINEKRRKKKRKHHHRLKLQVIFQSPIKNHLMASINSITLTDLLPHKGVISVVDQTGTTYSGKLSNIAVTSSDATIDNTTVDPDQPNTIDITAVTKTGGSTITFTADFTPDSPIDGQSSFIGLKGSAIIVNNVTTQLSLQVTF